MAAAAFLSAPPLRERRRAARRHLIWLAARTAFEIIINAGEEAVESDKFTASLRKTFSFHQAELFK